MSVIESKRIVSELNRLSGILKGIQSVRVSFQGREVILMPIEVVNDISDIIKGSAEAIESMSDYIDTVSKVISNER